MKKIFFCAVLALVVAGFGSCKKDSSPASQNKKEKKDSADADTLSIRADALSIPADAPSANLAFLEAAPLEIPIAFHDSHYNHYEYNDYLEFEPGQVKLERKETDDIYRELNLSLTATIRLKKPLSDDFNFSGITYEWSSTPSITLLDKDNFPIGYDKIQQLKWGQIDGAEKLLKMLAMGKAGDTIEARFTLCAYYGATGEDAQKEKDFIDKIMLEEVKAYKITDGKINLDIKDVERK